MGTGKYQGMKWDGNRWIPATPAELAAHGHAVHAPSPDDVLISTTNEIAGQVIARQLGVVTACSAAEPTAESGTDQSGERMLLDGLHELQAKALALGATGVVGVQVQTIRRFGRSDPGGVAAEDQLLLLGTAVVTIPSTALGDGPPLNQGASRGGMGFGVGVGIPIDFG
jgi:uncharacterized protein YbjQ (UPF0145 family)